MSKYTLKAAEIPEHFRPLCAEHLQAYLKVLVFSRLPAFFGCGGRKEAFDFFVNALSKPEPIKRIYFVDSEDPVKSAPWEHLRTRVGDGWEQPVNASPNQLHFMATCTESWLIADRDNLKKYFGKGFKENDLPSAFDLENRLSR